VWHLFESALGEEEEEGEEEREEDLFESALGERRALEVFDGPDLVCELLALLALHRGVAVLRERLQGLLVLPQVNLRPWGRSGVEGRGVGWRGGEGVVM